MGNVWIAFGLTLLAGLATGIGSAIAFFARRTNFRFLSVATGFSAGVMLYVSFMEILKEATCALTEAYGEYWGPWVNAASFFGGIALIALIDVLVPGAGNPHTTHTHREMRPLGDPSASPPDFDAVAARGSAAGPGAHDHRVDEGGLLRVGLFTALAIGIHNFPEGSATFVAALQSPGVGLAIAVAIALHNIPEGISISVPIYYATGNRRRAFVYSFLSGLAELVGAMVTYCALRFFAVGECGMLPPQLAGVLFGGVAGIMVYISLDELLPTSRAYGKSHDSLIGLVGGMATMALSLLLVR